MKPISKENLIEDILKIADQLFRQLLPSIPKDLVNLDVTMPQAKIMIALYIQGPQRMSNIASELDVALPTATSFIERLVEKGYVVRETQPNDRRVVLCRLSAAGQKAINGIWESSRIRSQSLLEELDTVKLTMFLEVLQDMQKTAQTKNQSATVGELAKVPPNPNKINIG